MRSCVGASSSAQITALRSPSAPAWTVPRSRPHTSTLPPAIISPPALTSPSTVTWPWCRMTWPERTVRHADTASPRSSLSVARPRGRPSRRRGPAALPRGGARRPRGIAVLPHQLQQARQLLLGQRALADIHHQLRSVEEVRPLADLSAQRIQNLVPCGLLIQLEP